MVICSEGRGYRLSDVRDFMVICSEGRGYRLSDVRDLWSSVVKDEGTG